MFRFILPKMIFKVEKWKWNKEFRVYVSNTGSFKDEHKQNIPFMTTGTGYLAIRTPYGVKLAHRLVMMTWKPIPNAEDLTVDHLNHNKRDNSVWNLEWVTQEENLARAERDRYVGNDIPAKVEKKAKVTVKGNVVTFSDYDAAVEFLKTDKCFANNPTADWKGVKSRIKVKANNGTAYAGYFWKKVN